MKKIALNKNISVKIYEGKLKDNVQFNKKNKINKFLFKFWKPKVDIETGIKEVFNFNLIN